ncbi:MAG: hypothetical protein QXL51_00920 [Candidatus Aenigmatarchaeota archaeon]
MKLYLAGVETMYSLISLPVKIKYGLASYYYMKNESIKKILSMVNELIIDSGGYTARIKGIEIQPEEYGEWLLKNKNNIYKYFNLDHKNKDITTKNQKILEQMGLTPIPIWHPNYGEQYLQELMKSYDYIAIGNLKFRYGTSFQMKCKILTYIFNKYPKFKFHLFGVTDCRLLNLFKTKIYSVDSTSWNTGSKYGNPFTIFSKEILKTNTNSKPPKSLNYKKINTYNLIQWVKFQEYLDTIKGEYDGN